MNSDFMTTQAAVMAKRLLNERPEDLDQQIAYGAHLAFNRPATKDEISRGSKFVMALENDFQLSRKEAMDKYCLMILNTNAFVYLN